MNGVEAEAHIGRTLRDILGSAASRVEEAFRHVFATGSPLPNFEMTARLPKREGIGHWVKNYYPIKNKSGKVYEVGVIVLEVTKRKIVERRLLRLSRKLRQATQALTGKPGIVRQTLPVATQLATQLGTQQTAAPGLSLELLKKCISETEALSTLLRPQLRSMAARHDQLIFHPQVEHVMLEENLPAQFNPQTGGRSLSYRECQLVQLLAEGRSNKEIAGILKISVRTVETYRARVMLKINARSLAGLVQYAIRNGII
jgi:DNA-binding CsgD family transcriptional regulator